MPHNPGMERWDGSRMGALELGVTRGAEERRDRGRVAGT